MNKFQKNYFGRTPSVAKNTLLLLGFALIVSVLIAYFFKIYIADIKIIFGESFDTTLFLFFGLMPILIFNLIPYLNNKYIPQFKKFPDKKKTYIVFVVTGLLFVLVGPLVFGQMVFKFLSSFDLPFYFPIYSLPFIILFSLSLILNIVAKRK